MNEKVFDREGVMMRLDNDEELFHELLGVFEEEWPRIIQEIESALSKADAAGVSLQAHSLKGALGNVGAAQAAEAARRLEFCGKDGKLSEGPDLLSKLVAAINLYRNEIRAAGLPLGDGSN